MAILALSERLEPVGQRWALATRRPKVIARHPAPDDLHLGLRFPRPWPRQLVLGVPGFHPADDVFVEHTRRAGLRLVERLIDVGDLPGIDIDKGGDRLAREIGLSALPLAGQCRELFVKLGREMHRHCGDFGHPHHPAYCSAWKRKAIY